MAYVTNICRRCRYDNDPQAMACVKCCAPLSVDRPAQYESPPQFWLGPIAALALVLVVFAVSRPASQQAPNEEAQTSPVELTSIVPARPISEPEYELVWEMPEGSPNPRMLARRRQEMFRDRLAAIEARDKSSKLNPSTSTLNAPWKRRTLTDIARRIRSAEGSNSLSAIRNEIASTTRDPSDTGFTARLAYLDRAAAAKMGIGAANSRTTQKQKNLSSDANIRMALR